MAPPRSVWPPSEVAPLRRARSPITALAESTSTPSVRASGGSRERLLNAMATFVFRLINPRPTFALDMSDDEREVMARHAAHWQPYLNSGQMVVFGPIVDGTGSWGLGVVEVEDDQQLRSHADKDPVVTTGTGRIELGKMLFGFVRGQ
jgi:uncharacterized protein